ncbi:MAG: PAS domain S-box protein [Melioribacteraceae bacterium]
MQKISKSTDFQNDTVQKQYEEMLHKYSHVVEQNHAAIIITDVQGIIKYVNQRFTEISGFTFEDVIGKNPRIFKTGYTPEEEYKKLWQTISSGLIWRGKFYNRKKNGDLYWESTSITPVTDENNKITHFIAIKVDFTERKKIEDELRLANEIISNMDEGVYLIRAGDGIIVYTNPKFDRMFGYETGELIGKHVTIVNAPSEKSPEETAKEIIDTLNKNSVWKGDIRNIKKDGTQFYCYASVSKFHYSVFGDVWIAVHQDITERKHAEDLLKKLQEEQLIILDSIPAWVFFKDTENRFIRVNKTFADIMGMSKEQLEGKSMFELYPKEQAEAFWKDDKEVIASAKPKVNIIEPMQSPKGNLWVQTDKLPYRNSHGNIVGIIGFTIDITERKNAEEKIQKMNEELKELNSTKDKFFSIVAHDMKTPFQGLLGYSQILSEEYETLSEEERKYFIKSIDELSKNTYELLDNLLIWSRIQTGRIAFNPNVFNLYQELSPTVSLLTQTAKNKNITIDYLIDKKIFVNADKNMLSTVIRNLIANAIKFTKRGGKIIISSKRVEKFVDISVVDNGVGIKKENLSHLFKIGQNVSTKGTEDEEGTGLGLILCKEMIQMHGGKIWVESELDSGSKFIFSIPVKI